MTESPSDDRDEVLDEAYLKRISGTGQRRTLAAWLEREKVPFIWSASGWPRVHKKALEAAMGAAPKESLATKPGAQFINMGAIK